MFVRTIEYAQRVDCDKYRNQIDENYISVPKSSQLGTFGTLLSYFANIKECVYDNFFKIPHKNV